MNQLLKNIYENIICYEKDAIKMDEQVNQEMERLLASCNDAFTEEQMTTIKSLMYQLTLTAEQEGFELGMRYAYRLHEALSGIK